MKKFNETIWAGLPFPDFRGRFFVESYWELLHRSTPHFYQARLMNVISSAQELMDAIKCYFQNERSVGEFRNAVREFDSCWINDSVAQDVYRTFAASRSRVVSRCDQDKPERADIERLRLICDGVIKGEEEYGRKLLEALVEVMTGSIDLSKRERITRDIYRITSLYITYLLNKGCSPTYLFNRMEYLTREYNYKGRTFAQQVEYILSGLFDVRTRGFSVIFGFSHHGDDAPEVVFGVFGIAMIDDKFPGMDDEDVRVLSRGIDGCGFVSVSVQASDYVSAAWVAKESIDKSIDFVLATSPRSRITVSQFCSAIRYHEGNTHKNYVNIGRLIEFLSSDETSFNGVGDVNETISLMNKLTTDSVEHLGRSLRYLRLGKESSSLEQRLLNTWIALESLFETGDLTIIGNITDYVPLIYAVQGVRRRVEYLQALLSEYKIELPSEVVISEGLVTSEIENLGLDKFFDVICNETYARALFDSIDGREHLRFRIMWTYKEIKSQTDVSARIQKTISDVERQLKRLYVYRNKIAHAGHFQNIRPQLIAHLGDYVSYCYSAIFSSVRSISGSERIEIRDALLAYRMGAEDIFQRVKIPSPPIRMSLKELMVSPVI